MAIDGAATGLMSTDIGIRESSTTLAGTSLQLRGNGQYYDDFTWTCHRTQSFGNVNVPMTFNGPSATPAPTPTFFSELHYDNSGLDVGKRWIVSSKFCSPPFCSFAFSV